MLSYTVFQSVYLAFLPFKQTFQLDFPCQVKSPISCLFTRRLIGWIHLVQLTVRAGCSIGGQRGLQEKKIAEAFWFRFERCCKDGDALRCIERYLIPFQTQSRRLMDTPYGQCGQGCNSVVYGQMQQF